MTLNQNALQAAMQVGQQLNQAGVGLYEAMNEDLTDFKNVQAIRPVDLTPNKSYER